MHHASKRAAALIPALLLLAAAAPGATSEWRLTWADEFDGERLDAAKWAPMPASYSNHEKSFYDSRHAIVSNGVLTLLAERKTAPGNIPYTSGAISSQGLFSQTYGRFEARIKLPTGQGYWPAFWLMPEDQTRYGPWPACGEIDILETAGDVDAYCGTLHFGERNNQHGCCGIGSKRLPNGGRTDAFHVYAVEWEPREIRWLCDGVVMGALTNWCTYGPTGQRRQPPPAPFDQPFYIILNLAVGGEFVGNRLPEAGNTTGRMEVDYVRVYARDRYTMPEAAATEEPVVPRTWKVAGPSQVADGAFDDPDLVLWLRAGAKIAEPEVVDGALKVHLLGDVQEQHLQMMSHVKRPKIRKGQWYRLSFKAKSSVACRHVRPVLERPNAGWQKLFLYQSLAMTPEWRDYAFEFEALETDPKASLLFYFGLMAGDEGGGNHVHWFDDVRLEPVE